MRIYRCPKGRFVCSAGDPYSGLWFLVSGELRIQTHLDRTPDALRKSTLQFAFISCRLVQE